METSIEDLDKKYDLELDKVILKIKSEKHKRVLLQFAEGLKPYATSIVDYFEKNTNAEFIIWFGDCFGACDTPVGIDNLKIDLMIQFGHSSLMPEF